MQRLLLGNRLANRQLLGLFLTREDGTVTVFSLLMFVLMVAIGGIAVDIMRYETQRVQLQYTLDRAVLAAAALDQPLSPTAVVEDYLQAAGLRDYRVSVQTLEDVDDRRVTAFAEMDLNTVFMHMFGIRALTTPAASQAEQAAENVEISLVLDISGSMRNPLPSSTRFETRIDALRTAAIDFTHAVVGSDETGLTSVNIVPYAGHVNPGATMFSLMGGQRRHDISSCIEFNINDFRTDVLPSGIYEQVPHFMNWRIAPDFMNWGWCPQDNASILYAENRVDVIADYIRDIRLHDGTATHVGMKYGLALLNPESNPAFAHLVAVGEIPDQRFTARPAAWGDPETQKFLILMTDGRITEQVRPMAWDHELNPTVELQFRPGEERMTRTQSSENFQRFEDICAVARSRGVVVFAIAFEAPSDARQMMRECATSDAHFYDTSGDGLVDAFASIAASINHLRLTE